MEATFDGVATLVSVFIATGLAWLGFKQNQRQQKEEFTLNIMSDLLTNESFAEDNAIIMRYVEQKKRLDPLAVDIVEDRLLMGLLSMYEYISINFLSDKMDREIILRQRRSGLVKTYAVLSDYIDYKRVAWDRPNAYKSFERVVVDYASRPN